MSDYPKFSVAFEISCKNEDRLQAFELYQKAFGAKKISEFSPSGLEEENLHIVMELNGALILLHPSKKKITGGSVGCQVCFDNNDSLQKAYDALCQEGESYSMNSWPHAPLSALVTDKYEINWWLHT